MTSPSPAAPVPDPAPNGAASVPRRGLLRGSAVLAGVAVGGAAAVLSTPSTAHAADGDAVEAGATTETTSTTGLRIGGDTGSDAPALSLENSAGAALRMEPVSAGWSGQLEIGDLVGSDLGPLVGVDSLAGTTTTYLVTGVDLGNVPTPFAAEPKRLLDLRTPDGQQSIIRRSSSKALAPNGRLRAGEWIDIAIVFTAPDYSLTGIFANLTAVRPVGVGNGQLYPPGIRPVTSSINFVAGQTIANAAFVGTGSVLGYHAVRLTTTTDSWFLLDVTGGVSSGSVAAPLGQAQRAANGRAALDRRLNKALGQLKR